MKFMEGEEPLTNAVKPAGFIRRHWTSGAFDAVLARTTGEGCGNEQAARDVQWIIRDGLGNAECWPVQRGKGASAKAQTTHFRQTSSRLPCRN